MTLKTFFSYFVSIKGQLILIALSWIFIASFFKASFQEFQPFGKKASVLPATQEIISKWSLQPTRVKTGLIIHRFLKFDPAKNDFLMNGIIWFEYDEKKISQEKIDKFSFSQGEIVRKSDPIIDKMSGSMVRVQYYIQVQFSTTLDYTMFPLDDHIISLNLVNYSVQADTLLYDVLPEDFVINSDIQLPGWKIALTDTQSGFEEYMAKKKSIIQPKAIFSVGVKKIDLRQLLLMLLPLLILFHLSLLTLLIKDFTLRIESIFVLITAYMASSIVIQSMSPEVNYFMIIDFLNIFFLLTMFVAFIIGFLCESFEDGLSSFSTVIAGLTVIMLHTSLLTLLYYLIYSFQGSLIMNLLLNRL